MSVSKANRPEVEQRELLQLRAENARLRESHAALESQLAEARRELDIALEQQTATAEILRIISSSPTDIQPVLDAMAESAARLCGAHDVVIRLVEGHVHRTVAHHGPIPITPPLPLTRAAIVGRAILDARTVHIPDVTEAHVREEYPEMPDQVKAGHRSFLVVPLVREDTAIGVIIMRRLEVRPFTDKQINLLETFAAQAVIAIENVRLFKELEARNTELSESLEQQIATAEILRVISELADRHSTRAGRRGRECSTVVCAQRTRYSTRRREHAHPCGALGEILPGPRTGISPPRS